MGINAISHISRNSVLVDQVKSILKYVAEDLNKDFSSLDDYFMNHCTDEVCKVFEEWFNLKPFPDYTLEDRIERLIYTFNSKGFCTVKFLKDQSLIFQNGEIEVVEDFENYRFDIKFTSTIGTPPNLQNYREMVEINKPAHLVCDFILRFRTHEELKPFQHSTLKKYTHEELRSGTIIKK